MCNFFSFVTEPDVHGGERFYADWEYRKAHLKDDNHDSHSSICQRFGLAEDKCNKYEFNPLTKDFNTDQINSTTNDALQAEEWVRALDFKCIAEPLIIKPIINPFNNLGFTEVTAEMIDLLKQWVSVGDSIWALVRGSVWASIRDSVRDSVEDSIWVLIENSVWDSVWNSVWASVKNSVRASDRDSIEDSVCPSVKNSVRAYASSFFDIQYKYDFSSVVKLWEMGLVPSFDGKTWRLHSGKNAKSIYKISKTELEKRE